MENTENDNTTAILASNRLRVVHGSFFRTSAIYYGIIALVTCIVLVNNFSGYADGYILCYLLLSRLILSTVDLIHVKYIQKNGHEWNESRLHKHLKTHIKGQFIFFSLAFISSLTLSYQTTNANKYVGVNKLAVILILSDILSTLFQIGIIVLLRVNPYWGLRIVNLTQVHNSGTGATPDEINTVPVYRYGLDTEVTVGNQNINIIEGEKGCLICLSDYDRGDEIRVMECSHFSHKTCIDEWYQQQFNCPKCRFDIRTRSYPNEHNSHEVHTAANVDLFLNNPNQYTTINLPGSTNV